MLLRAAAGDLMLDRRAFVAGGGAAIVLRPRPAHALAANYERAIANVFVSEGGYSNDVGDPGGPTNFGITLADARLYAREFGWLTRTPTAADVRAMPKWFAEKVYRAKYADVLRFDALPAGLDYTVLDYGINSGVARPPRVLAALLHQAETTKITDGLLRAIHGGDLEALISGVNGERAGFLTRLSAPGRPEHVFRDGWLNRVRSVRAISLDMAGLRPSSFFNAPLPAPVVAPHRAYAFAGVDDQIELPADFGDP